MRFMVLVKADDKSEAGVLPSEDMLVKMHKFNEELVKAGILLGADGLQPTSKGARINLSGGKPVVTDGPFAETKELLAGYWMIQGKSLQEVVERFKHCPPETGEIEVRQVFDAADFAPVIDLLWLRKFSRAGKIERLEQFNGDCRGSVAEEGQARQDCRDN